MSPVDPRELQQAIEEKRFALVYYLHGSNDLLKERAIRKLIDAAVDAATSDFNLDQVRGEEVSGESLGSLLYTPPLMAERRVVIVRDVLGLRKDGRQVLTRYLSAPSPTVTLVVASGAVSPKDELHDALMRDATPVEFDELGTNDMVKWISRYARESLGTDLSRDAVDLLIAATGGEMVQLVSELEKLASYTGGGTIDRDAVSAVVGVRHGETPGDLFDAVAARDAPRALALVPFVLQQPKVTLVQVLMGLTTQMLAIAWGHAARERGMPAQALSSQFYNLLRESRAFPGRAWGEAIPVWVRAVSHWDGDRLREALDALLQADRAAKEARYSSEEQLLSGVILRLCGTTGGVTR